MTATINASTTAGVVTTADTSGILQLQTNGTAALTVDASQNVGIGTASPAAKFNVVGGRSAFAPNSENFAVYLQYNSATNGFYIGSPSADAMVFSASSGAERMRIDSSGNVGINTTSPARTLHVKAGGVTTLANSNGALFTDASNAGVLLGSDNVLGYISGVTAAGTATVDLVLQPFGGSVFVGTTGSANGFAIVKGVTYGEFYTRTNHPTSTPSGFGYADFLYNGSGIGSISQNGTTGVLYNLTSDYRLKNNPVALTGAKDFVMALQPKKWQWWDGSGEGVGFIAHEFMEVAKYSGNGIKDAVDDDGKPIYQSIQPSSSEVMANMVAFIQELKAIVDAQGAEIAALKAQP